MVHSVRKAINILRLFTPHEPRLSLTDISKRLEMPKSTAHNLLNTLLVEGFVEKVEGDLYALGTAPLELTQSIRVNVEVRDPAAPLLRTLADETNESVYLTVLQGNYALYIYAIESPRRLAARTAIGDLVHLHCTSVGKAMLAFIPAEEVDQIVTEAGMPAFTDATITDMDDLHRDLAQIRQQGFSLDRGEHEPHTFCIGAPIFNAQGHVFAACSLSGAEPAIVTDQREALSQRVVSTARQISRHMGFVPARRTGTPIHTYQTP